ncbi:ATP-dependent RNA helicase ddx42 [Branchiostoma belcheri]|nr:ATP-dependent RNA helicase ddx42 [Branchiostoma belcheri]
MNWHKGGGGQKRGFGFGGFALGKKDDKGSAPNYGMVPPVGSGRGGVFTNMDITVGRKRHAVSDEQSPGRKPADSDEDSEEDPLDSFMAQVETAAQRDLENMGKKDEKKTKEERFDIDEMDDQESYFKYMEENPLAGVNPDDDDPIVEYDEDGNPIVPEKSKIIDPLPPIDHSEIDYPNFERNFYEEHGDISKLSPAEVNELRRKLDIRISGAAPPKLVTSFAHFGFDEQLMHQIRKSEYSQPTPIQAQGIPVALSGRDIIGIAKTGSGKTAAFVWPMLVHIMDQKELEAGDGPIGLICAPTRELSQQIYAEAKRFGKCYGLSVVAAYGGGSMWEQTKALQLGAEIVVCTPGRLIDLVKKKATNLQRVTYLVFDEADRMFDMGFALLFSATFKKRIERLCRDILMDPIKVVQGDLGEANEDVQQIVEIFPAGPPKWQWLTRRLVEFTSVGSVLIFVTKKANSEELASNLKAQDFEAGLLHGDMDQSERNKVISEFKKKTIPVLVATDVAARGLDIPSIKTVVNYDVARDIDTHTHRIGRTGRAGEKGVAYTLITTKDVHFAPHLVRNLEGANQRVPEELMNLAMQNNWFRKNRFKGGRGKKITGFQKRERPGLGADLSGGGSKNDDYGDDEDGNMSAPMTYSTFGGDNAYSAGASRTAAGPQSDRLSALKSAFMSQYQRNFQSASDSSKPSFKSGSSLSTVGTSGGFGGGQSSPSSGKASGGLGGFQSGSSLSTVKTPGGMAGFQSGSSLSTVGSSGGFQSAGSLHTISSPTGSSGAADKFTNFAIPKDPVTSPSALSRAHNSAG